MGELANLVIDFLKRSHGLQDVLGMIGRVIDCELRGCWRGQIYGYGCCADKGRHYNGKG